MRTLRFFAFGPAPLLQRTCTSSSIAAHAFVSKIRPVTAISDDSVFHSRERSSYAAASPLSSTICGSRLYSKKGKKDVLLEERQSEGGLVLEDEKTKKKKKVKEVEENVDAVPVNNVVSEDAESPTKSKKKKTKNKLKQEEVEVEPKQDEFESKQEEASSSLQIEESEMAQNGASSAEEIPEVKGKKKSRNKSKLNESEDELPQELESDESTSVIEDVLAEEFEEHLDDDDFWEDDYEPEAELNDGGDGGGIVLGDAALGKIALELAEKVVAEFNGALEIFAFKVSKDTGIIRVRVDKLSDKYGSPTMDEIQQFSSSYTKLLDKAGEEKTIPDYALEVSSPGAERVVRIPKDLERFKDLPMYVRYIESSGEESLAPEKDGIMQLESVDMEVGSAKWKLADVRLNRDLAGKGRGLTRKQRDWRIDLPFESIQLVRLYIDL